jgi:hypothetical protein
MSFELSEYFILNKPRSLLGSVGFVKIRLTPAQPSNVLQMAAFRANSIA